MVKQINFKLSDWLDDISSARIKWINTNCLEVGALCKNEFQT